MADVTSPAPDNPAAPDPAAPDPVSAPAPTAEAGPAPAAADAALARADTPATPSAPAGAVPAGSAVAGGGPNGSQRPAVRRIYAVVPGLALLLPAVIAWLWSYVVPSATTLARSFERGRLISGAEAELVGMANYERIFESGAVSGLVFAFLLALLPAASALLIAPLLAVVAERGGRGARMITRALLAFPLAAYAPVAVYLGWLSYRFDAAEWRESPRSTLVWMVAFTSFGLVIAVATTLYLSALGNRDGVARPGRRAAVVVTGPLALGIVAVAMQVYTVPALLRVDDVTTPAVQVVDHTFRAGDVGTGAAVSILLLAVLAGLGLAAVGLLLATRARIVFVDWRRTATADHPAASAGSTVLCALALVAVLGVTGYALLPWLQHALESDVELPRAATTTRVLLNTWMPPLISAVVAVGLAGLAGFGIGALRPLGRWSELLLLPFAPWLFVGDAPLAVAHYLRTTELGLRDSALALIPPGWLSIPALVAFTLLFRGQAARWRAGAGLGRTLLLPALPLAAAAVLLTWLIGAQQFFWPTLMAVRPDTMTAPQVAHAISAKAMHSGEVGGALALVLPVWIMALFLLAFVVLQVGYLDRLAIRVGHEPAEPAEPAVPAPR